MSTTKYDRVYYWTGGTEHGEWRESWPADIDKGLAEIRRMGYHAVKGLSTIGAPEGNPLKRS